MVAAPAATARLLWDASVERARLKPVLSEPRAPETAATRSARSRPPNPWRRRFSRAVRRESRVRRSTSDVRSLAVCLRSTANASSRPRVRVAARRRAAARTDGGRLVARPAAASRGARHELRRDGRQPAERLAHRLGLPPPRHVVESALVDVPTVVGWLRPAILLPIAALASLTPAQVEAILAHELAHIRRHDYAVNLLQTIVETLLFYHPAVWWLSQRIRVEREHCCDDIAIAVCGDPLGYAQALAELETWRTYVGGDGDGRDRRLAARARAPDSPRAAQRRVAVAELGGTLVLTIVFTAGAGAVQHLPSWIGLQSDARVSATRATDGDARLNRLRQGFGAHEPRATSVASASNGSNPRVQPPPQALDPSTSSGSP